MEIYEHPSAGFLDFSACRYPGLAASHLLILGPPHQLFRSRDVERPIPDRARDLTHT